MSDALTPLRHAYGLAPEGAPAAPGEAGHAEQEALRQLHDALEAWPAPPPAAHATAAVEARAAVVAAAVGTTDAALSRAFASRPQPRPDSAAVAAVLARAAHPDVLPAGSPVEAAVLDQSLAALDRLPAVRPDAAVIATIEARAAQVSAAEAAALDPMRAAVGRAFTSRPQPRPSADAVAAVLARAAEPFAADEIPAASVVEAAVLAQSMQALDRLPRPRPSAATLDAVRVAAATAGAAAAPAPAPTPTVPFYQRPTVWGPAAFVMAAVMAVVLLPFGGLTPDAAVPAADGVEVAEAMPAPTAPAAEPVAEAPALPPPSASPTVASAAAVSGIRRAVAPPQAAPPPSPSAPTSKEAIRLASATPQAARGVPATPPSWEPSDDVRMLSLRLDDLDPDDALAWDEAPVEAFGAPAPSAAEAAPGVQAVRAGAAPARARLRSDSTSANR